MPSSKKSCFSGQFLQILRLEWKNSISNRTIAKIMLEELRLECNNMYDMFTTSFRFSALIIVSAIQLPAPLQGRIGWSLPTWG